DLRGPLFRLADFRRLTSVLQEARSLAAASDDRPRLAWTLAFLAANQTFQTGDLDQVMEHIQRAEQIAAGLGEFELTIVVSRYLGQILFGLGEYGRAIEVLRGPRAASGRFSDATLHAAADRAGGRLARLSRALTLSDREI